MTYMNLKQLAFIGAVSSMGLFIPDESFCMEEPEPEAREQPPARQVQEKPAKEKADPYLEWLCNHPEPSRAPGASQLPPTVTEQRYWIDENGKATLLENH